MSLLNAFDKGPLTQEDFAPGKIVSLWQLMETFDAGKLFISLVGLSNLAHMPSGNFGMRIPIQNYQSVKNKIDFVCQELERIGLPVSLASPQQLRIIIYNEAKEEDFKDTNNVHLLAPFGKWVIFERLTYGRYGEYAAALISRVKDELSTKMTMFLPYDKISYFDGSTDAFPPAVRDSFPSAEYDMNESAKCFALSQQWHLTLRDIETAIKARNVKQTPDWRAEEPFYAEAVTHFRMVKDAWRNHTMHIKERYDEERAKDIMNSVAAFMRHLATKLHE